MTEEVTDALQWQVAKAISIPQHHTGWDILSFREKDLFFMQADYAIDAMRSASNSPTINGEVIEHMVQRFLAWRLPENFRPDAGISFTPDFNVGTAYPMKHQPTGTNLFDYEQAKAMVRHMIEGLPEAARIPLRHPDTRADGGGGASVESPL